MNLKIQHIQNKILRNVYYKNSPVLNEYVTVVHKDDSIDAMIAMIDEGYTIQAIQQLADEQTRIEFK